jgi:hypothetical protein
MTDVKNDEYIPSFETIEEKSENSEQKETLNL